MKYILVNSELDYLATVTSEKRQNEYIKTRFMLRELLHMKFGLPKSTEVLYTQQGKPYIENEVSFNYSHSGDYVLFGFSKSSEIGVDIETKQAERNYLKIAKKYFSLKEKKFILNKKLPLRAAQRFQILWSLKEAYFKSANLKLSSESTKICFDFLSGISLQLPLESSAKFVYTYDLGRSFSLAASFLTKEQIKPLKIKEVVFNRELHISDLKYDLEYVN